jgi:hypothetical protein
MTRSPSAPESESGDQFDPRKLTLGTIGQAAALAQHNNGEYCDASFALGSWSSAHHRTCADAFGGGPFLKLRGAKMRMIMISYVATGT